MWLYRLLKERKGKLTSHKKEVNYIVKVCLFLTDILKLIIRFMTVCLQLSLIEAYLCAAWNCYTCNVLHWARYDGTKCKQTERKGHYFSEMHNDQLSHFLAYMKNMFSLRSSSYDLRGNYILSLSKPKTTTYGLNSFSYFSAKQWNALPDFFRTSFFADFKTKIQDVTFM